MLKKEEYLPEIDKLMTLAAYVHYTLTGEFMLGGGRCFGDVPYSRGLPKL